MYAYIYIYTQIESVNTNALMDRYGYIHIDVQPSNQRAHRHVHTYMHTNIHTYLHLHVHYTQGIWASKPERITPVLK